MHIKYNAQPLGRTFPHPLFTSAPDDTSRKALTGVLVHKTPSGIYFTIINTLMAMEGKNPQEKKKNGIFSSRNFDCYMKYKNKIFTK